MSNFIMPARYHFGAIKRLLQRAAEGNYNNFPGALCVMAYQSPPARLAGWLRYNLFPVFSPDAAKTLEVHNPVFLHFTVQKSDN